MHEQAIAAYDESRRTKVASGNGRRE
jgi:hypothetical protein